MPLLNDLITTYDKEKDNDTFPEKIAPIAHEYGNADIQITVTEEGKFVSAAEVNKDQKMTLLAVTTGSQSRTNNAKELPHAINDKLIYLTKNIAEHCPLLSCKDNENVSYEIYTRQLEEWCNSAYSHPKARAVLRYVESNDVIGDLIGSGILKADQNGVLGCTGNVEKDRKYQKTSVALLVRFSVLSKDKGGICNTWEDTSLQASWSAYYLDCVSKINEKDLDGLAGKNIDMLPHDPGNTPNYPKKVLVGSGNAKLISVSNEENDKKNEINNMMNFEGERFTKETQRLQIGYITSQKIHNTLRWLMKTQSIRISAGGKDSENRCIICWDPAFQTADIYGAGLDLLNGTRINNDFVSGREYLRKAIRYGERTSTLQTGLTVAVFDAATTGRCTMVYYQKMMAREFFDRIESWYEKCSWYFGNWQHDSVSSPSVYMLARCAFGTEIKKNKNAYLDINEKMFKKTVQDIVMCVLNGQPLPEYIVRAIVTQASSPLKFDTYHEAILRVACAVIRQKLLVRSQKGDIEMDLNKESTDRSYLFGRILAVADAIEQKVLHQKGIDSDKNRVTNAIRLWSAYVNHPMTTWQELKTLLLPYELQLSAGYKVFYQKLLEEIVSKFDESDMGNLTKSNRALEPQYLLGFYLQRRELYTSQRDDATTESQLEDKVDVTD